MGEVVIGVCHAGAASSQWLGGDADRLSAGLMMADLWHIVLAWMMWPDFTFFEALARVRGIANIPMATMLTRTGRIFYFAFCIMRSLLGQPEPPSKACTVA